MKKILILLLFMSFLFWGSGVGLAALSSTAYQGKIESVRNSDFLRSGRFGCLAWSEDSEMSGVFLADEVDLRHIADIGAYHLR